MPLEKEIEIRLPIEGPHEGEVPEGETLEEPATLPKKGKDCKDKDLFWARFEDWLGKTDIEVPDDSDITTVSKAMQFMVDSGKSPWWAADFCPKHEWQPVEGGGYQCPKCGGKVGVPPPEPPEDEEDDWGFEDTEEEED